MRQRTAFLPSLILCEGATIACPLSPLRQRTTFFSSLPLREEGAFACPLSPVWERVRVRGKTIGRVSPVYRAGTVD